MAYGVTLVSLRTTLALIFTSEGHSSWIHLYMNHISKISTIPVVVHADHRTTCQQAVNQSLVIYQVHRCTMANRSSGFMQFPCDDLPLSGQAIASPGESSFKYLPCQVLTETNQRKYLWFSPNHRNTS